MASFEQIIKFENEKQAGGARRPAEPLLGVLRLAEDGSPYPLPTRQKLPHGPPPFPVRGPIVQFVTVNAAERGEKPFLAVAEKMLDAARFYHEHGRWFLHLFLVMPDHLHMLANFPSRNGKATCGAWKGFLRKTEGIRFQSDCFEHRIRNESEFAEKWHYIRENPVRKGLVDMSDKWPYWMAFDSVTGMQTGGARRPAEPQGEGGANPLGEPDDGGRLAGDGSPQLAGESGALRLAGDGSPQLAGEAGVLRLAGDGSPHPLARPAILTGEEL